jgi:hypothetical protein
MLTISIYYSFPEENWYSLTDYRCIISISSMYQSEDKLRIGWLCKKNTLAFYFLLLQNFQNILEL